MPALHVLHSPLARHPQLLARKIAARLGLYREDAAAPPDRRVAITYPPCWQPALRHWLEQVPLFPPPHPFNRVFGHDWDEQFLLDRCRGQVPNSGQPGLRNDIKVIWDYSRAYPLFTNVAALR